MSELVIKQDEPGAHIVRLTLARPAKLNVFDDVMLEQLETALKALEQDKATRVVILRGEGGRAFSAGADIKAWSALEPLDMWRHWIPTGNQLFDRLASLRQPVIAAIDGVAFGGGLELAMAADIRMASRTSRFALPETGVGTIPGWSGVRRLVKLIGLARAKNMVLTGEQISAETAEAIGLVSTIHEPDRLDEESVALATLMAARAPIATQLAKAMLNEAASEEPGHALQAFASAVTAFSDDGNEGTVAFKEKRQAHFKGN